MPPTMEDHCVVSPAPPCLGRLPARGGRDSSDLAALVSLSLSLSRVDSRTSSINAMASLVADEETDEAQQQQPEGEEEEERMCRYCLEDEDPAVEKMISPCACKGGQKFVHLSCLRRWQRLVLVSQPTHPAFYEVQGNRIRSRPTRRRMGRAGGATTVHVSTAVKIAKTHPHTPPTRTTSVTTYATSVGPNSPALRLRDTS